MSETTTASTAPTEGGAATTETAETSTYTPPATQADLDRIVAERVNRTKAQFKDYAELQAKAKKYDELDAASKTELQKAQDDLTRWQSETERWRGTAVQSRIEALAAPDFEYPSDAAGKLDPSKYLDAGGAIDEAAIKADLAALLAERPSWARQSAQTGPRAPAPNRAQGAGGNAAADPAQQFAAILQGIQ
jgi:hypothetical protein